MDREKVINELRFQLNSKEVKEHHDPIQLAVRDAEKILALLKEDCHNCKLECLLQKYDELKEKYDAMLKEQEAVKPVNVRWEMGINGGNCPKCMNWAQRTYNYCPFCGKEVKWDA